MILYSWYFQLQKRNFVIKVTRFRNVEEWRTTANNSKFPFSLIPKTVTQILVLFSPVQQLLNSVQNILYKQQTYFLWDNDISVTIKKQKKNHVNKKKIQKFCWLFFGFIHHLYKHFNSGKISEMSRAIAFSATTLARFQHISTMCISSMDLDFFFFFKCVWKHTCVPTQVNTSVFNTEKKR